MIWPSPRAWIHHPQWLAISMAGMKKKYQFLWFITIAHSPPNCIPEPGFSALYGQCDELAPGLAEPWVERKAMARPLISPGQSPLKERPVYSCLVLHSECHECPLATVDLQPLPEMMLLKDSNNIKELERDYLGQKGPKECATHMQPQASSHPQIMCDACFK